MATSRFRCGPFALAPSMPSSVVLRLFPLFPPAVLWNRL